MVDAYQQIPSLGGERIHLCHFRGKRVFPSFPMSATVGLTFMLSYAVYHDLIGVIVPAVTKVDRKLATQMHSHGNVQINILSHNLVIEISHHCTDLEALNNLDILCTGGTLLPQSTGDIILNRTRLLISYGATECCNLPIEISELKQDWAYFKFSPFLGADFRPYAEGLQHMVIVRDDPQSKNKLAGHNLFRSFFVTNPHPTECETHDLFVPHPTARDMWRCRGRIEVVLTFPNRTAWCPNSTEALLVEMHPEVRAAMVCRDFQSHTALTIELEETSSHEILLSDAKRDGDSSRRKQRVIEEIWLSIETSLQENKVPLRLLPRENVIFTVPEKPVVKYRVRNT